MQEQLGRASITLTTSTYGKRLPKKPVRGGVNSLDEAHGGKAVAKRVARTDGVAEIVRKAGEPSGTRTLDPLIKSQVLYQLS